MRKILLPIMATLALAITSCGGAPAGQQVYQQLPSDSRNLMLISSMLDEDFTRIDKEQYPDLYKALLKSDYNRVADLIGPATPSTQQISSGGTTIIGIKTMRDGQVGTLDDLLHYAMKKGDLRKAKDLLKEGADPNSMNERGHTALHVLYVKSYEIPQKETLAEILLDGGASPKKKTGDDSPLLHLVLESDIKDKPGAIRHLLKRGADQNQTDKYGNTSLHKALSPAKISNKDGVKSKAILSLIEPIINRGVDLDARNQNGLTALSYASGVVEKYLLGKGAKDYGIKPEKYADKAPVSDGLRRDNILGMSSLDILGLEKDACESLLRLHGVKFTALEGIENVEMPIRLESDIGGIRYRHTGESKKFSIMDSRFAAALVGWGPLLKKHGVVEVVHMRAYSPNAKVGGGSKVSGHSYALALDAARFGFNDGTTLVINDDWSDRRYRAAPCETPEKGDTKPQAKLRNIVCEAGEAGIFSMILTPHYNQAHYDHLHLEVTDEVFGYVH